MQPVPSVHCYRQRLLKESDFATYLPSQQKLSRMKTILESIIFHQEASGVRKRISPFDCLTTSTCAVAGEFGEVCAIM